MTIAPFADTSTFAACSTTPEHSSAHRLQPKTGLLTCIPVRCLSFKETRNILSRFPKEPISQLKYIYICILKKNNIQHQITLSWSNLRSSAEMTSSGFSHHHSSHNAETRETSGPVQSGNPRSWMPSMFLTGHYIRCMAKYQNHSIKHYQTVFH